MYRPFVVPDDDEFFEKLGQRPTQAPGEEPTVRQLSARDSTGRELVLRFDLIGRSIRLEVFEGSTQLLDVFRESATRMTVSSEHKVTIEFLVSELAGSIQVDLGDPINVVDKLLFD